MDGALVGDGPDASELYVGDSLGGSFAGSTLRIEDMTLEEYDFFDWQIGAAGSSGARVVVTNGGVLKLGGSGAMAVRGADSGFVVAAGASFHYGDASVSYRRSHADVKDTHFVLAALGETLTIEGLFTVGGVHPETPAGEGGQWIRLRGNDAQMRVTEGVFGDVGVLNEKHQQSIYKNPHPVARDFDVVFEPVGGGYTNTVSYAVDGTVFTNAVALVSTTDAGRALGEATLEESVGKIRLSVDVTSMHNSPTSAKGYFVLWKNGIDTTHVELVPGAGYTLSYTYGWPSTLSEPANAGDLPTGVWADVPAQAGTLILVK